MITDYRKIVSQYLGIAEGLVKEINGVHIIDASEAIDENFVGTISSILSHTKGWETVIGLGNGGENIKISMRSSVIDSKEFLDKATRDIGIAGGHKEAAGGYIPKIYKGLLLERIGELSSKALIESQ